MAALTAMIACGDSDDPIDPGDDDAIAIALSDAALTILQGEAGTTNVTLTRQGGYTGTVNLAATGLPTGVTAAFTPAQLTAATAIAQLELTAEPGVTPGDYNVTVTASGSGVTDATAALALTIDESTLPEQFTIAVDPTTLQVQQGQSGTATVTATREAGFDGEITFGVTGAPQGMTVTFDPESTDGDETTVTVAAAAGLAAGNYDITIQGNADGAAQASAQLQVTVTEAAAGGNTTWTFCEAVGIPVWVAARDGDGDWVRVQPGGTDEYTFDVTENGSIAYVTSSNGSTELFVYHGTQAELSTQGENQCIGGGTTRTVTGSVEGVDPTDQVFVSLGDATTLVLPALDNEFTLENVPEGELDLIATRVSIDDSGDEPVVSVNSLILRRGLDPADGSELDVLDFSTDEAFEPVEREITVNNAAGEFLFTVSAYVTPNGAVAPFFTGLPAVDGATNYFGIPADRQQAGDLHVLYVGAWPEAEDPLTTRTAGRVFAEATDQTIDLGPGLAGVMTEVIGTDPYVRLQTTYTAQAEYGNFYSVVYSQATRTATIAASSGFFDNGVTLTIPDFTGVDGWDNAWGLQDNEQVEWYFSASGWTGNGIFDPDLTAGAEVRMATQAGTITP